MSSSRTFDRVLQLIESGDVRISEHGYEELAEDGIVVREIVEGASSGAIVEDYPDFPKGPSVLVLQFDDGGMPLHVVWGVPRGFLKPAVVVTAYRPDPRKWDETFTRRRK